MRACTWSRVSATHSVSCCERVVYKRNHGFWYTSFFTTRALLLFLFLGCAPNARELMSDSGHLMYEQHGVMGGAPVGSSWWFQADVHRLAVVDPRPRVGQHASESDNVTVESTVSTAAAANPTGVGGFVTRSPMFEEVVDIISQVDIVRCLVDAYDRGYPADHKALRRVFDEPVTLHAASRPFGTFDDAPVGAVFADMLRRGYSAAVVVARAKNTFDHAGDTGVWRAVDTLSTSDFRDVRDVLSLIHI